VLAALLLLAVSAAALWFRKSAPFLAVGWFWFLGTLVPVIGFIQVGGQAMADRYSYLPSIGLFIAASWALAQLAVRWNVPKPAFALAAAAALIPCLAASYRQVDLWRDSVTLFNHAVTVTDNNLLARVYLGDALLAKGDGPGALANFSAVSAVNPSVGNVQGRIAKVLAAQGRVDDAINGYRRALKLNPDLVEALNNLAWILATTETDRLRDGAEAVRLAERACQLTHYRTPIMLGTLAAAYAEAGRFPEAIEAGEKARQLALAGFDPALAETNQQLLQLYRAGRPYREPAVK
jgi:tetratricopeptide (TPR) repeat protein